MSAGNDAPVCIATTDGIADAQIAMTLGVVVGIAIRSRGQRSPSDSSNRSSTAAWPLPAGLGGVIGDAVLQVPAFFFGPASGMARLFLAGTTGALALTAFAIAAGMFWRDPEAEQEASGICLRERALSISHRGRVAVQGAIALHVW
jgi:hypothetical protein